MSGTYEKVVLDMDIWTLKDISSVPIGKGL